LYGYAGADPIGGTDPFGLCETQKPECKTYKPSSEQTRRLLAALNMARGCGSLCDEAFETVMEGRVRLYDRAPNDTSAADYHSGINFYEGDDYIDIASGQLTNLVELARSLIHEEYHLEHGGSSDHGWPFFSTAAETAARACVRP
jgi:hypothetical protein